MSYLDNATEAGDGPVVIISASVGAGHDGAAAELARRLRVSGVRVELHDFLDLMPGRLGPLLSSAYHRMLTHAPWGYQRVYAATEHRDGGGRFTTTLLRATESRMLAVLPPDTRAVVSTYPLASQVLGALRRSGRLAVPALTYLTDFSVHSTWVARGIDLHLATHTVPARQARAVGARHVLATGPLVASGFAPPAPGRRSAARDRFSLPLQGPLALLVAGSWGVGDVVGAAQEVRDAGGVTPVVVCGRNSGLAAQLREAGIEHVFEWVEDMPTLMRAVDVLVQNAGGLTSLEALASGVPVVSYNCIPGHGRTNAAALEEAGLAPWIRTADRLRPTLSALVSGPARTRQQEAGLALFHHPVGPRPEAAVLAAVPRSSAADATAVRRAAAATTGYGALRRRGPAAVLVAAAVAAMGLAVPETTEAAILHSSHELVHALDR
ncbi:glycosyltransferase [Streptomyces sp. NPDC057908]|uniref:MGDG synthase family glycosyltransferase n=1 Tax=Streptomyces sp. NPDC057908 TaxID=3346276 RepID=UPI0036E786DA